MNLEVRDKKVLSDLRMARAREFLEDAAANHGLMRHRTAINRSYYAALNAIRSILILEGVNPETHEGSITMLSLRFVKPGMLPTDTTKKYKVLLSRRTDADYGDVDTVSEDDSADSVRIATELIERIDSLRLTLLAKLPQG